MSTEPIEQVNPMKSGKDYVESVHSIYILNSSSVSEEMIIMTDKMLHEFVMQFPDLYNPNNRTCNLHSLLHLPQVVRDFGPLYTTSCFPFENANGILKSLVKGNTSAQLQICSGISAFMSLPQLKNKLRAESVAAKFCQMIEKNSRYKMHQITDKFVQLWANVMRCYATLIPDPVFFGDQRRRSEQKAKKPCVII
ncbi:unnamed protein product [Brassicogethes aeneus]|uniref:Uncharacterized protein n=1 Tax=Brassicogethes aeneus TaxID=1431903 RepID=A0A9P0FAZ6_BRAAE|nr:unnamed protein product [Brassicogethes aeneus]